MNPFEVQLVALVRCLSAQQIEYAIIGGIAVAIYGEPRFTSDIDVSIFLNKKSIGPFLKVIKNYGFSPAVDNPKDFAGKCGVIPLRFAKDGINGAFDIILAENPIEFATIKRSRLAKIGAVEARFVSPEDLILQKLSSTRARDFEDVEGILSRQRGKLDLRYITGWLKRIDAADRTAKLGKLFSRLLRTKK